MTSTNNPQASAPVAVLLTSWLFRVASPKLKVLLNVFFIVFGVTLASLGEIKFVWIGFFFQAGGIFSEAIRLILIQILLSDSGQNMDPLVSLYYYAPICTVMNFLVAAVTEFHSFRIEHIYHAGIGVLLLNAVVAFLLNGASVFLIGKTSGLIMTLCGVLKNILLVLTSVLLFGTIIMPLQILGYTIALLGLIYYGVGYEGIQTYYSYSQRFVKMGWEGEGEGEEKKFEGVSTSTSKRGLGRKVIVGAVFGLCVLGLVLGTVVKGRAEEFVQGVRKGLFELEG